MRCIKGYWFLSFAKILSKKYGENVFDNASIAGPDAAKTASQNVVHKTAEVTRELIGNRISGKIAKPKHVSEANPRNVEGIVISSKKIR